MAAYAQVRALIAVRLSDMTDVTTSPLRQREAGEAQAARIGARVVGYATDLDVSATKTTPFERPELGDWLRRPDEFDVIIWWRLDRAVRSLADMEDLARWAKEHRKRIIFAEGAGGTLDLDMSSALGVGEIIVRLLAWAAQMEAQAIAERVSGARAALRAQGRWPGGIPPYGYRPVPRDGAPGLTLVPDPSAVSVLEQIMTELLDGAQPHTVAMELNAAGVRTPRDHDDVRRGKEPRGRTWVGTTVKSVVTSPTLLGYHVHQGKPVRDGNGRPVLAGPPIVERDKFEQVKAAVAELAAPERRERKDTNALLLGVAHCANCEGRMYMYGANSGKTVVYGCRALARGRKCETKASIRADWLDEWAETHFLQRVGAMPITRVVRHPGYDPGPELVELTDELRMHMAEQGRYKTPIGQQLWGERRDALELRVTELMETPRVEPREELIRTGETYGELWALADQAGRRRLLVDAGARVLVSASRGRGGRITRLDESRVSFQIGAHTDPEAEALDAIRREESE
ncbi:recombinase family protein [Streptomyces sp. SID1046]|uniref:recombinase family protein n=1 Tax=Streptomyces sp. SID1046 TaxID=2690249 RepID=UPI00136FC120|nr:recombinase family protein [Streptomyces sp. SID1046]MYV76229.1 recombinase family protein [Streptomyces sp. SID1046]